MALLDMRVVADGGGYWLVRDDAGGGEAARLRAWAPALAGLRGLERCGWACDPAMSWWPTTGSLPAVVERSAVLHPGAVICLVAGQRVTAMMQPGQACAPGDQVRLRVDHHTVFDPATDQSLYHVHLVPDTRCTWVTGRGSTSDQLTVQVPLERRSAARSPGPLRSLAAST